MDKNTDTLSISGLKRKQFKKTINNEKTKNLFGYIIIGRINSAIGYSYGKEVTYLRSIYSNVEFDDIKEYPEDRDKYETLMIRLKNRYLKRISKIINSTFYKIEEICQQDLDGLYIGGPNSLKIEFIQNHYLDKIFEEMLIDIIKLKNQGFKGFKTLIENIKFEIFKNGVYSFKEAKSFTFF